MRILVLFFSSFILITSCSLNRPVIKSSVFKEVSPYLYYYEGVQNRLYGNHQTSISNLKRSLELQPDNPAVYYELALNYAAISELELVLSNIRKAVELEPSNPYYRSLLSNTLINNRNFSEALENQKVLIDLTPDNFSNKYQLGLLYSENGDFENALIVLNELENRVGIDPRIAETKARIFLTSSDLKGAQEQINLLIDIDPSNPVYYLYKGDVLFKIGEDSLAFEQIFYAQSLDTTQIFPTIELYKRFLDTGKRTEALKILEELVADKRLEPEEKISLYYPILFDQIFYNTKSEELDLIIENLLDQYNSIPINELAFEHFIRTRNFPKVLFLLSNLRQLDSSNPSRFEKLISFEYSIGNKEDALINAKTAVQLFPTEYIFYVYKSLILEENRRIDEAIKNLYTAAKNVTENEQVSELYGMIGDYYYKIGDNKKAFKSYNKSLKYNGENARILNNYSYYLALSNNKLRKALEMSTKAVDLEPNNSTYIDTKGWVLFVMGRYEESRDVLRNAIAKGGGSSAIINEHYGDALYLTGNKENAYIYWLKAKEIGGGSKSLEEKIRTRTYVP